MTCALCLKERELRNSHIIPEFFYKPLYDENHRFSSVPLSDEQKRRYEQKGIRERLLCGKCEGQLAKYEDHVRRIFYGGTGIDITYGNPIKIEGIDYKKFKLFQLSLLWRASVSSLEFFRHVILAPHQEKIRQMILAEDPGKILDYPCIIFVVLMEDNEVMDDFIYPPQMIKYESHRLFRFLFGGCFWIYFVSSHTNMLRITESFLTADGQISISLIKAEDTEFFREVAKNITKYNRT